MTSYQGTSYNVQTQQNQQQQPSQQSHVVLQQSHMQQLQQNMLMTMNSTANAALPISVTASSHPGPFSSLNAEQAELTRPILPQQLQNSTQQTILQYGSAIGQTQPEKNGQWRPPPSGVLTSINNTSETRLKHPSTPQMPKILQSISRSTITLPARLAAPGSGITLPTSVKKSDSSIRKAERRQAKHTIANINGKSKCSLLYSSACRASVTQQAVLRTLTETNRNSLSSDSGSSKNAGSQRSNKSSQNEAGQYQKVPVVGGKNIASICKPMNNSATELTPQLFLEKLLRSRGYCTQNYCSLDGGYYCKPTPLQKASYGVRIVQAVRQSNPELLEKLLKCGLSPNPCNAFGESVVHMVCRRGDFKLLKVLKDAGCSLQVTDDFGRTPLHDACWTAEPNFETVDMILDTDLRLLNVVDCRGSSPLNYVKRDHWGKWIAYFQSKVEQYWAPRDVSIVGGQPPPLLCNETPNSRPISDPATATDLETAQKIASGKMEPAELRKDEASSVPSPVQMIRSAEAVSAA
mmetsp:Transcript_15144/g.22314  ORF Transcript_15144/g.22314 Transcript_15144/m.22314 type:complete len:521 (-) Transcript_15144:180-1742(-)